MADNPGDDTPDTRLRKSKEENEALRKQLTELQALKSVQGSNSENSAKRKSKKKHSARSPVKKKKKRIYILDSSDSDTQSDTYDSDSSVPEKSDSTVSPNQNKKTKIKKSKTVISRSTNNIETPTMKPGMKYPDWVHWVNVWQHSIKIPKKEQAMLLLQALPIQTEKFGNIQKLVADNLGIERNIKCSRGVENIIKELDKLYKKEEFPALITFMRKGRL